MSRRRRRGGQRRASGPSGAPGAPQRPARRGWRATLDSVGGLPVVGSVVAALFVVAVLIALNRPGSGSNDEPYEPHVRTQTEGRVQGDPGAPVRILAFEDFQCPHCGRAYRELLPTVESEFIESGAASLEFVHYPFLGEESVRAAEAAQCADRQDFFWEYYDILFQRQPSDGGENVGAFTPDRLKEYAGEMATAWAELDATRSFDTAAFDRCVDERATADEVQEQYAAAQQLGVSSTPTFSVNGRAIVGLLPDVEDTLQLFRDAVAEAQGDGG